ncbi:MAG: helix-turn-helix domain-containing protein [Oscillospiraceae bacterium]|nr:helix-turn-helix domain-containing protein [Oscillospiraceae bacterium]
MDTIRTGKFIAEMRKEQKLTQRQLAQQLNISDKTISKWECGNGMPEVSLMLPLCNILHINVNELLSGEKISLECYQQKAEENMMNLMQEKQESKKKIVLSAVVATMGVAVLIVNILLASYVQSITLPVKVMIIAFGAIVFLAGLGVAVVLDRETGSYECPHCKTHFTPEMGAYVKGLHTITKRKLKCPNCGQTSYCKHKLTKQG